MLESDRRLCRGIQKSHLMLGEYPVNLSLGKTNSCCAGDIGNPMLEIGELLNRTLAKDEVASV